MAEPVEKIVLSKLPQPETFGLYIGFGIVALIIVAAAGYFSESLWAAHSYLAAGIIAAGLVLPSVAFMICLALMAREDLNSNRQLPDRIAKCKGDPLPAADYEKFLEVAKAHPEVQGFIAEALNGRDFMTRGEAEALATQINTYLEQGPQRELTALVNKTPSHRIADRR